MVTMKFNSIWHEVTEHCKVHQLLSILQLLAVPKILPDDIFLFLFDSST